MENQTKRKTIGGLAGILAGVISAGTMILAPTNCTPQRTNDTAVSKYSLEEQAYNFANSLVNNTPKASKKEGNGLLYHDSELKFTEDRYDPVEGQGRYALIDGRNLSVGYCDANTKQDEPINKFRTAVVYLEDLGGNIKKSIMILSGPDYTVYSEEKDGWKKAFYDKSQLIEGADILNLPAKLKTKANMKEVIKWLELVEKLRQSLTPNTH